MSYTNLENRNHCDYVSKKIYESIFQKYWLFSFCNWLFHIFWMHGLEKLIVENYFFYFKYHQILIEIYKNLKFLAFLMKFHTATKKIEISATIIFEKFYESIFQNYWQSSFCNCLFHIFWTHGLEKIHCGSFFLLFQISSNFDWKLSKSLIFLAFLLKFHTPT